MLPVRLGRFADSTAPSGVRCRCWRLFADSGEKLRAVGLDFGRGNELHLRGAVPVWSVSAPVQFCCGSSGRTRGRVLSAERCWDWEPEVRPVGVGPGQLLRCFTDFELQLELPQSQEVIFWFEPSATQISVGAFSPVGQQLQRRYRGETKVRGFTQMSCWS